MPARHPDCLANQGRHPATLYRYGTRLCPCADCRDIRRVWRLLHCVCPCCQAAEAEANAVADAHDLNRCEVCERTFWSQGRANVCSTCWDKPLCRVCWRPWLRPGGGVVCVVCVGLLMGAEVPREQREATA